MRKMKLDENLVGRVESFMEERWVETVINGDGGELIGCNTGLPQGSPASPILFLQTHKAIENVEENVFGLSF
jgi:hypothetical protein